MDQKEGMDFDREYFGRYIAARLKKRVDELGMKHLEVAEKLGVSQPALSNVLGGRSLASLQKYGEIARAVGFTEKQFDALVLEARKAEFASHGVEPDGFDHLSPEEADAAFMSRHNIPEAKKRDLMRFLKVLQDEEGE